MQKMQKFFNFLSNRVMKKQKPTVVNGFSVFRWQLKLIKQLATEDDRNTSSMLRRIISEGLSAMGHGDTVLHHDPAFAAAKLEETDTYVTD
jgi:hypothetical protein